MSQRRMGVILGGVILAVAAVSVPAYAQGPQRGNRGSQGDQRGGGQGGFNGGRAGGFGRGGSLVDLAGREAVQKEIKVTEEQKPKIENLAQETRSRRERTMQQMRQRNEREQTQARNSRPVVPPVVNAPVNQGGAYGGGDVGGYGSTAFGGNVQNQGPNPAQLQQMAEMQQQQQERMVRMQGFEQMRQAMDGLQRQSDQALAKILEKEQMTRLREIQLQMEGPFAILSNNQLAQTLSVTPQQVAEIRDAQTQDRQRQGQLMQQSRSIFEAARNAAQPDAGAQAGAQPGAQAGGQPGARPGGQPGAQQGNRGGRGNFDREAFREMMQKPEVQAQLDQLQQRREGLRQQAYASVFKALDRGQASKYRKLLGEPFDTGAMMRGFLDRFTGNAPQSTDGAAATPADDEDDDAPAAKPATPAGENAPAPEAGAAPESASAAESAPAPAPTNRRSSLRERRGLGAAPQQ